jgi:fructose-1,6-bisphosphatase I
MIGTLASGANPMRKKKLQTFVRYLEVECWKRSELRELEPTLQAIADACKQINRIVQRAQTDDLYGVAVDKDGNPLEETNVQGEVQQKLDVVCNTIMMRAFCGSSKSIHSVASEEEDEVCKCSDIMVSLVGMPSVTCFCICVYHTPLVLRLGEYIYVSD